MTEKPTMRAAALLITLTAMLTACGPMPEPTAVPATTTVPAAGTGTAATDTNGTATAATPASGQLTLGELAARIGAAWPAVRSYRVTFTGATIPQSAQAGTPRARAAATPGATPVARERATFQTVREVVLPDRQRQQVAGLGANDHEAIASGGRVFVRGPLAEQIAPGTSAATWIEIDAAAISEGAQLTQLLGGLPAIPPAPLASLRTGLGSQTVREMETIAFDGRECRVYAAADTVTATGMRVDYTIALDDRDLPCFIETSTGGAVQGRDEYTAIDAEIAIEPPAAATPVSVPAALATPVARD
jgi:hypothetical protein